MPDMQEILFPLWSISKQLQRLSKRAEKDERIQRNKIKEAIQQGYREAAKIYAANAIRKKNEALKYLRMASKIDALSSKVQSAIRKIEAIQQGNMEADKIYAENAIRKKNEALKYLRMASKIDAVSSKVQSAITMKGVSAVMEQFEQQSEDLDVRTSVIEDAMGSATTTTLAQVDSLIAQATEENGLDIMDQLAAAQSVPSGSISAAAAADRSHAEEDAFSRRLAAQRN